MYIIRCSFILDLNLLVPINCDVSFKSSLKRPPPVLFSCARLRAFFCLCSVFALTLPFAFRPLPHSNQDIYEAT